MQRKMTERVKRMAHTEQKETYCQRTPREMLGNDRHRKVDGTEKMLQKITLSTNST